MASAAGPSRAEAEAYLYREARLLDERRFEEWLALFAPDGRYFVPGGTGDDPGAEAPIVDDDHATLEDRVQRLRSPATHAQSPPSRTLRLVGNVEVEAGERGPRLHCALVLYEARLDRVQSLAARCLYRLVPAPGGDTWQIALKQVRLVHHDQPLPNLTFLL